MAPDALRFESVAIILVLLAAVNAEYKLPHEASPPNREASVYNSNGAGKRPVEAV